MTPQQLQHVYDLAKNVQNAHKQGVKIAAMRDAVTRRCMEVDKLEREANDQNTSSHH